MSNGQGKKRKIEIYRYDPAQGGEGHFDHFDLYIENESKTTILDVLIRLQKERDSTLAFRFACRVNMCGSCAMVINGREGLACKTNVSDFSKSKTITIRPLNHYPIIKDLVVDMDSFFQKYEDCLPFFEPKEITEEPAIIRPDSRERQAIGLSTECITCGCCMSSCTMSNYHESYAGPASLNRAFTLLMDSRDSLYETRLGRALQSCYNCRSEFNCTEVCPKDISCTRAIKYIQRLAIKEPFRTLPRMDSDICVLAVSEPSPAVSKISAEDQNMSRRSFFTGLTLGIGALSTLTVGGILASVFIGPAIRKSPIKWVQAGRIEDFKVGEVSTGHLKYKEKVAFYQQEHTKPVMVWRQPNEIVVYSATCTHLGCTVRWDATQNMFICACHGGAFELDGSVKAGPPQRPLERLAFQVDDGNLMIEMV